MIGLAHCNRCARVVPSGPQPGEGFAEGLTPCLRAADGVAMLRRIVERFSSGELVFDGWSRAGVWLTQRYGPVKPAGAQLSWSIDDPHELEKAVPGLVSTRNGGSPILPISAGTTRGCTGNSCGVSSVSLRYNDSGEACATTSGTPVPSDHDH